MNSFTDGNIIPRVYSEEIQNEIDSMSGYQNEYLVERFEGHQILTLSLMVIFKINTTTFFIISETLNSGTLFVYLPNCHIYNLQIYTYGKNIKSYFLR